MKEHLIQGARKVIPDPNTLINLVSLRVKQFKQGARPLVESLENLDPEEYALKEIIEGKITYELYKAPSSVA